MGIYNKLSQSIVRIQNDDTICLTQALVIAIDHKKKEDDPVNQELAHRYNTLRDSRWPSPKEALELMTQAGITEEDFLSSIEIFQAIVLCQINLVVYDRKVPLFLYKDSVDQPTVHLLSTDNHFDVITKMAPLFARITSFLFVSRALTTGDKTELLQKSCYTSPACIATYPRSYSSYHKTFNSQEYENKKVSSQGGSVCTSYFCTSPATSSSA